jgi:hypothetical protein
VAGIAAEKTGTPGTGQAAVRACTSDAIAVAVVVFRAVGRYSGAAGRPVGTPGKIQDYGPLSKSD